MARYGRSFPPSTSQITQAQLQVPLAGLLLLSLPTPLILNITGGLGTISTMTMSVPTPMRLAMSGAVGTGAVAGDMSMQLSTPLVLVIQGTAGVPVVAPTGLYSSVDLLARCKFYAQRPAVDESMADADWYSLLTEANSYWVQRIAAVNPEVLYGPPQQIFSLDGGYTYTFGTDADGNPIYPIGSVELRQSPFGREWLAAADWDNSGDFIRSGAGIRFPGGKAKTFANGPVARFVTPGGTVNATVQPTVNPPHARMLLVWQALINWATRGGFRDPTPWMNQMNALWYGDSGAGSMGILAELKTQYMSQGSEALAGNQGRWWSGVNTGDGYSR